MRAAVFVLGCICACASSRPGGVGDDDDDGDGDGGGGDGDGGGTAVDDGGNPVIDARPPDGPIVAPPTTIFVAVAGSDGYAGTDPAQPLRSLSLAIERAAACTPAPCTVWMSRGTFEESVVLSSGVDVQGGYALGFASRDIGMHQVILTSVAARTVIAVGLDSATILDGLTIRGADLSASFTGEASHALWVADSGDNLTLRAVRVEGGGGGRGTPGDDGVLVACTTTGGAGGAATDCNGGGGGSSGDAGGDPALGGSLGTPGASNCPNACPLVGHDGVSDGVGGGNGANGNNGATGAPSSDDDGGFTADTWSGQVSTAGDRGRHGTGGAGGGAGGTKKIRSCFGCSSIFGGHGGDGAPGGCAGGGGAAGASGGASFAVTLIRSDLHVASGVQIIGGTGGRGGDGGDGHPGGPGGTNGDVNRQSAQSRTCGLINYYSGAGAPGGIGGHGGHGGGGAGGGGGPAVGVALVGVSQLLEGKAGTLVVVPGQGGAGGFGGSGAVTAPSGIAGRVADYVAY